MTSYQSPPTWLPAPPGTYRAAELEARQHRAAPRAAGCAAASRRCGAPARSARRSRWRPRPAGPAAASTTSSLSVKSPSILSATWMTPSRRPVRPISGHGQPALEHRMAGGDAEQADGARLASISFLVMRTGSVALPHHGRRSTTGRRGDPRPPPRRTSPSRTADVVDVGHSSRSPTRRRLGADDVAGALSLMTLRISSSANVELMTRAASASLRRCAGLDVVAVVEPSTEHLALAAERRRLLVQVDEDLDLGPQQDGVDRLGDMKSTAPLANPSMAWAVSASYGGEEDDRDVLVRSRCLMCGPSRSRPCPASARPAG